MAKATFEQSQSYLQRGRRFQSLSEADLDAQFVALFQHWAADLSDAQRRQATNDVIAEYALRKIEAPYHKVEAEMELLADHAKWVHDEMSEEEKQEVGGDIVKDYQSALNKKH